MDEKKKNKWDVRILTLLALLTAMSIVFTRILSISTGFVRFNLGSLPVVLAGIIWGPWAGFAVGAVADIIGGVLAGYAINPLITLGSGAIGFVAGMAWHWFPVQNETVRLSIAIMLGHIIGSMVITSMALRIFYSYPWSLLAVRIPNAAILAVIEIVLVKLLMKNKAFMNTAQGRQNGRKNDKK